MADMGEASMQAEIRRIAAEDLDEAANATPVSHVDGSSGVVKSG